jgi:hypothetical protein
MRLLILIAVLMLAGCGGFIDRCPDGLAPPPGDSKIPAPHG